MTGVEAIGAAGTLSLALCGVPQAWKSWRDGHSDGVSAGMLALWGLGTALVLTYVSLRYTDWMLLANYAVNAVVICVILRYKAWPRTKKTPGSHSCEKDPG